MQSGSSSASITDNQKHTVTTATAAPPSSVPSSLYNSYSVQRPISASRHTSPELPLDDEISGSQPGGASNRSFDTDPSNGASGSNEQQQQPHPHGTFFTNGAPLGGSGHSNILHGSASSLPPFPSDLAAYFVNKRVGSPYGNTSPGPSHSNSSSNPGGGPPNSSLSPTFGALSSSSITIPSVLNSNRPPTPSSGAYRPLHHPFPPSNYLHHHTAIASRSPVMQGHQQPSPLGGGPDAFGAMLQAGGYHPTGHLYGQADPSAANQSNSNLGELEDLDDDDDEQQDEDGDEDEDENDEDDDDDEGSAFEEEPEYTENSKNKKRKKKNDGSAVGKNNASGGGGSSNKKSKGNDSAAGSATATPGSTAGGNSNAAGNNRKNKNKAANGDADGKSKSTRGSRACTVVRTSRRKPAKAWPPPPCRDV